VNDEGIQADTALDSRSRKVERSIGWSFILYPFKGVSGMWSDIKRVAF
jgi:hypothetical protein